MKNNGQYQTESSADDLELKDLRAMFTRTMQNPPTVDVDALLVRFEETAGTNCQSDQTVRGSVSKGDLSVLPHRARTTVLKGRLSTICVSVCMMVLALIVFESSGTKPVLAQTQDALNKVRNATYTITEAIKGQPKRTIEVSVLGRDFVRAERSDGTYFVLDLKGKKMLEVVPHQSKAVLTRELESPVHFSLMARVEKLNEHAAQTQPGVPERDFGDRKVSGFVIEVDDVNYSIWLDQKTNLPLRLESRDERIERVWSNFTYNKELDESAFSLKAPGGFEVEDRTFAQERENAEKQAVRQARKRDREALEKARAKDKKDLP